MPGYRRQITFQNGGAMHLITLLFLTLIFNTLTVQAEYRLVGTFPVDVKEPSGLTYDPVHDSLWTVQDGGGDLYEIDKKGNVLKKVPLKSGDLEGIAYKPDTDTFLLAEERRREVVEVDRTGKVLRTIKVPIEWHYWNLNYGIEGVAFEPRSKGIFVANEKKPCQVMEMEEDGCVVHVFDVEKVSDISDLYYDAANDRLLVLSHESKSILELNRMGHPLKSFPIEAVKAEGITKDSKGYLYIICEDTSTLYVYAPEVVPTSEIKTEKVTPKGAKKASIKK
jgi:uncharacterized protein YjiK